jgi:hypothetical protein
VLLYLAAVRDDRASQNAVKTRLTAWPLRPEAKSRQELPVSRLPLTWERHYGVMQLANQVAVLLGVIVGALGSYLTTAATERARWKRALDSRWDDRRVEAYALYAQSVKRMIKVAVRIAAGRGLGGGDEPLAPTSENLELLADAEAERSRQWENVLLLGHPQTVAAGRRWHERAWRLEAYARGLLTGSNDEWQAAVTSVDGARQVFYESARTDLGVGGGALPGSEGRNTRAQRIRNLSD